MSGIDGVGPTGGPARAARNTVRPGSKPGRFVVPDDGIAAGRPNAPPAATLDTMLALQEAELAAAHEREARRHGQRLLQALAGLQSALLDGGSAAATLARLRALLAEMPLSADPALRLVLQSVALRARIELARHQPGALEPPP